MKKELRTYKTIGNKEPFIQWIEKLKDSIARAQITNRLNRAVLGNYGDYDAIGNGVLELRIHYGSGYRVYFAEQENSILLLLGGSKRTQAGDIKKAKQYLADFRERCYD